MATKWALVLLLALSLGRLSAQSPEGSAPLVYGQPLLRKWVPPEYPKDALKEGLGGLVAVRFVVDEKGNVTSSRAIDASDPRFADPACLAVRKWVFSPALEGSNAVARSMDASVVFSPHDPNGKAARGSSFPAKDQMPVLAPITEASLVSSPDIEYPDSLFDRKLSGRVHYTCRVLPDGSVTDPRITATTHVDFVQPALKALADLKYTPRMQGDIPVATDVEGILRFDLTRGDLEGALAANNISAPDGNPPPVELAPLVVADPIFPFDLLNRGQGGTATVLFDVNKDGYPSNVRVRDASEPQFGKALVAAVEMSAFLPPTIDGRPAAAALMRHFDFPAFTPGGDGGSDPLARVLEANRAGTIARGVALDSKLVPRCRVSPVYPAALRSGGLPAGQAVIEFVVDRDGRVRIPRIVSASDERFGWSAATAVSQWVFDAPRHNGQPVDVSVQVPFNFKAPTG